MTHPVRPPLRRPPRDLRRIAFGFALVIGLLVVALIASAATGHLGGGASASSSTGTETAAGSDDDLGDDGDDWVVLSYEGDPLDVMDALQAAELEGDSRLRDADVGLIDGNDVGVADTDGVSYELYYVGRDREEMWRLLRPIFERPRVHWLKVELRHGLDDPAPRVIAFGDA